MSLSVNLKEILKDKRRKLVVAEREINLKNQNDNLIFILYVEESSRAAGGRGGGSGNRRIERITGISSKNMIWSQIFDTVNQAVIEKFDIPYSAVAMDIEIDSEEIVVQGLIDKDLITSYKKIINTNL